MTTNKDFKRLVRSRMLKTGESYTTARVQLLKKHLTPDTRPPAPVDFAKLAGISDAAIKKATGCNGKTFAVPVARLFRAFHDTRTRRTSPGSPGVPLQ